MEVKSSDAIKDVKTRIKYKEGTCPYYQQIIIAGEKLENGKTYNIEKESLLILKLRGMKLLSKLCLALLWMCMSYKIRKIHTYIYIYK